MGKEMAVKVAIFTNENCEKTFEMVDALSDPKVKERSEIRRTQKCLALQDESLVKEVENMIRVWNEIMPGQYTLSCGSYVEIDISNREVP